MKRIKVKNILFSGLQEGDIVTLYETVDEIPERFEGDSALDYINKKNNVGVIPTLGGTKLIQVNSVWDKYEVLDDNGEVEECGENDEVEGHDVVLTVDGIPIASSQSITIGAEGSTSYNCLNIPWKYSTSTLDYKETLDNTSEELNNMIREAYDEFDSLNNELEQFNTTRIILKRLGHKTLSKFHKSYCKAIKENIEEIKSHIADLESALEENEYSIYEFNEKNG